MAEVKTATQEVAEVKEVVATTPATIVSLVSPNKLTIHGSVVAMSDWRIGSQEDGATFKHDTRIISVSDLMERGVVHDVFITRNQWKEYGCEAIIFVGNAITFTLEDCIANKTGYKATSDAVVMTVHTKSYKAFYKVTFLDVNTLIMLLGEKGLDYQLIGMMIGQINNVRANNTRAYVVPQASANGLF